MCRIISGQIRDAPHSNEVYIPVLNTHKEMDLIQCGESY